MKYEANKKRFFIYTYRWKHIYIFLKNKSTSGAAQKIIFSIIHQTIRTLEKIWTTRRNFKESPKKGYNTSWHLWSISEDQIWCKKLSHYWKSSENSLQSQRLRRFHVHRRILVLDILDHFIRLNISQFVDVLTIESVWDTILTIWVAVYISLPDHIFVYDGSTFRFFCRNQRDLWCWIKQ